MRNPAWLIVSIFACWATAAHARPAADDTTIKPQVNQIQEIREDVPTTAKLVNAELSDSFDATNSVKKYKASSLKIKIINTVVKDNKPISYLVKVLEVGGDPITGYLTPTVGLIAYLSISEFDSSHDQSYDIVTGILTVPFKYHFTDHATTAGSTIGGYIGYGLNKNAGSVSWIVGGGLALVNPTPASASTTSNPNASTSTITGISIATGIIGSVGTTKVQFGVLVGVDLVEKSQNYKYDGKPWLSFTIGYTFSN